MSHPESRIRGVKNLVADAVQLGATAVEGVHRAIAGRTFDALEAAPPIAGPAKAVRTVHDAWLGVVYGAVRATNEAVRHAADFVIDEAEKRLAEPEAAPDAAPVPDAAAPKDAA